VSLHEESTSSEETRAQIIAAAEALRTWVRSRRDNQFRPMPIEHIPAPTATRAHHKSGSRRAVVPSQPAPAAVEPAAPIPVPAIEPVAVTVDLPPEPRRPRPVHRSSSILSLGAEEPASDDASEAPDATSVSWVRRLGTLLVPWLRTLRGPAIYWVPRAAAATAVALLVIGVIAGGFAGARWAARRYWPGVSATFSTLAAPSSGTAVFESVPPGSQVFVNGTIAGTTPFTKDLAAGRHLVEFRQGESIRSLEINVEAGKSTIGRLDWTAPRTGVLRVESAPTGATVIIDGRDRGVTPLTIEDLTVGSHDVVVQGTAGMVRRSVTIRLDRPTDISVPLYSGWLHVSSPIEVDIAEGQRTLQPDDQNRILLSPGTHRIQFHNRSLGYLETRQVQIQPGETTRVVIAPSPSTLTATSSLPAEVLIDGERAGDTPLSNFPIRLGTREVVVRAASGDERRYTLTVSATPVQLEVDFSTPVR
jgi:hypothetical protein